MAVETVIQGYVSILGIPIEPGQTSTSNNKVLALYFDNCCKMEFLHSQLDTLQKHLSFVTTDAINWKGYVQAFSWGVTLFETYLLVRQYPLYNKTEPPAVLAAHFGPETDTFQKSQKYGKDKAKFSIISGLYKQCIDSAMLQYGFYAWAWATGGRIMTSFGYGGDYEVSGLFYSR